MRELTELLEGHAQDMDDAFVAGASHANAYGVGWGSFDVWANIRAEYGFKRVATPLLTPPDGNLKLDKATVPSYGLTLQHYVTRLSKKLVVNACPNAGDCVKVCVLDNGNGGFPAVQQARKAKTDYLASYPERFAHQLGWELQRAAWKHGEILFRPNVNSDVAWERLLPSLVNGYIDGVTSYGYTKRPEVLATDGCLGTAYRVAYSWNESSDLQAVTDFLNWGGSVAVVTSRRKGSADLFDAWGLPLIEVLDADKTDEWIFTEGVIGDLSAKGKARKLIGESGFVVSV